MCISVCVGYEMVSLLWEGLAKVGFGVRFWHSILASDFGIRYWRAILAFDIGERFWLISTYLCKQTNKQDQSFSMI